MLDRKLTPSFSNPQKFNLPRVNKFQSTSNVPVYYLNSEKQPVIRLEFIFKAGSWYEELDGVSLFTAKLLNGGTASYTAIEISELFAKYGAFVDVLSGNNRVIYTVYILAEYVEKLQPLLISIFTEASFPQEEINLLKKKTIQTLEVNEGKTSFLAKKGFVRQLYGDKHPYGKSLNYSKVEAIKRDDLVSYYQSKYSRSNCEVLVCGAVSQSTLFCIDNILNHLPIAKESNYPKHIISTNTSSLLILKDDSVQSSIRIGRLMFNRMHEDYFNFYVLNEVLGGYFGSRLMKNIREEKGLTYGIYSSLAIQIGSGHFIIATDVEKKSTQLVIDEIYKEIQLLKNELIRDEELKIVINSIKGSYLNSIGTIFSVADKFKLILFSNLDYNYYDSYFDKLDLITSKDLLQMANKYFHQEDLIEVVAGGK